MAAPGPALYTVIVIVDAIEALARVFGMTPARGYSQRPSNPGNMLAMAGSFHGRHSESCGHAEVVRHRSVH